ncbi:unnamed protein product [Spodoptera littoralis]|uniref:Uncharacterized protein n=1 Tax=Spodoptera littoralis TaxID=7109 RepID=A0A9P0IF84_SPOLI|nr:unnamed protein product [Spodoptera littoralis]CAH1645732.1 unnamed protein product [Spodoptera littoralis]
MSGGSQHNPNGRQSQLGSGWSPLQVLQMANLLARAPQAHMASDRGVTWHTPTPPPHLYHVPAPSPPDPLQGLLQLQALKSASGNSVFRHTATPPELYRHTPTPPDKHHMRHTPSPGDIKASAALPPVDLYQHLAPSRAEKLRADDLMAYTRVGVDLSLGGGRAANGAATSPAAAPAAPPAGPALSVRDAPTINSLIARRHAHAHSHLPHARVDALLERLAPSPVSPHSVIVHSRAAPTPSPPSSNEDSADSCGAPPGSKRKRKPERTVRVAAAPPPPAPPVPSPAPPAPSPAPPAASPAPGPVLPRENGDAHVTPDVAELRPASPRPDQPHARRKTRSGSAETIDDIAAMIADTDRAPIAVPAPMAPPSPAAAVTVDKLRSVLASPEAARVTRYRSPNPRPPKRPASLLSPPRLPRRLRPPRRPRNPRPHRRRPPPRAVVVHGRLTPKLPTYPWNLLRKASRPSLKRATRALPSRPPSAL